jgi:Tol biopolymer transport system component
LYIVDSDGGTPRSVGPADAASQGYPTWTPDGAGLLFGIFGSNIREPAYLRMVDLRSGTVSKFEGSDGLFGPRWSPDGAMIAAMQWSGERHLMIYRVAEKRWKDTGQKVDWPCWTPDSKAIVFFSAGALLRYRVATGQTERLTDLKFEEMGGATHSISVGPDGSPLRTLNRDSRQIYELRF